MKTETISDNTSVANGRTTDEPDTTALKAPSDEPPANAGRSSELMLGLLDEFTKIYKDKLERLENSSLKMEEKGYLQAKVSLLERWLGELGEQNAVLVGAVGELEREAASRVSLLRESVADVSSASASSADALASHRQQLVEALEGRAAAEERVLELTEELSTSRERCSALQADLDTLLQVVSRGRTAGNWRCDDVTFHCLSSDQVCGAVVPSSGRTTPSCGLKGSISPTDPQYTDPFPLIGRPSEVRSSSSNAQRGCDDGLEGRDGTLESRCSDGQDGADEAALQLSVNIDVLAARLADAERECELSRAEVCQLRAECETLRERASEAELSHECCDAAVARLHRELQESLQISRELQQQMASREASPGPASVPLLGGSAAPPPPPEASQTTRRSTRDAGVMAVPLSCEAGVPDWDIRVRVCRLENEVSEKGILVRELQGHLAAARHECCLKDSTIKKVEQKLTAVRADLCAREDRRQYLERQLVLLQRQLARTHAQAEELARQVEQKGQVVQKLEQESWSLAGQLNARAAGADALQLTADHVAQELIARNTEVAQQRLTIASLQDALASSRHTCDVLRAQLDEDYVESKREIDILRMENAALLERLEEEPALALRPARRRSSARTADLECYMPSLHLVEQRDGSLRRASEYQEEKQRSEGGRRVEENTLRSRERRPSWTKQRETEGKEERESSSVHSAGEKQNGTFCENFLMYEDGEYLRSRYLNSVGERFTENCDENERCCEIASRSTDTQRTFIRRGSSGKIATNSEEKVVCRRLEKRLGEGDRSSGHGRFSEELSSGGATPGEVLEGCVTQGWVPVARSRVWGRLSADETQAGDVVGPGCSPPSDAPGEPQSAHHLVLGLLKECNALEEQIAELMEENRCLQESSAQQAEEQAKSRRLAEDRREELEAAEREVARLQRRLQQLEDENHALREDLLQAKDKIQQANECEGRLREELAQARESIRQATDERRICNGGISSLREKREKKELCSCLDMERRLVACDQHIKSDDNDHEQIKSVSGGQELLKTVSREHEHLKTTTGEHEHRRTVTEEHEHRAIVVTGERTGLKNTKSEQELEICREEREPSRNVSSSALEKDQAAEGEEVARSEEKRPAEGATSHPRGPVAELEDDIGRPKGVGHAQLETKPSRETEASSEAEAEAALRNGRIGASDIGGSGHLGGQLGAQLPNNSSHAVAAADEEDLPILPPSVCGQQQLSGARNRSQRIRSHVLEYKLRRGDLAPDCGCDCAMECELTEGPTLAEALEWASTLRAIRGECDRLAAEGKALRDSNSSLLQQVKDLESEKATLEEQRRRTRLELRQAAGERRDVAAAVARVVWGVQDWARGAARLLGALRDTCHAPHRHVLLVNTERRLLIERNAALQSANRELLRLLRSQSDGLAEPLKFNSTELSSVEFSSSGTSGQDAGEDEVPVKHFAGACTASTDCWDGPVHRVSSLISSNRKELKLSTANQCLDEKPHLSSKRDLRSDEVCSEGSSSFDKPATCNHDTGILAKNVREKEKCARETEDTEENHEEGKRKDDQDLSSREDTEIEVNQFTAASDIETNGLSDSRTQCKSADSAYLSSTGSATNEILCATDDETNSEEIFFSGGRCFFTKVNSKPNHNVKGKSEKVASELQSIGLVEIQNNTDTNNRSCNSDVEQDLPPKNSSYSSHPGKKNVKKILPGNFTELDDELELVNGMLASELREGGPASLRTSLISQLMHPRCGARPSLVHPPLWKDICKPCQPMAAECGCPTCCTARPQTKTISESFTT